MRFLLPLMIMASACHKQDNAAAGARQPASEMQTGAQAPEQAQPVDSPPPSSSVLARSENAVRGGVAGEVDPFLTLQLQIFVQQKGRLPTSFAEFARTRLDGVPRPPAGKKWAIDTATSQVKAINAN